MKELRFILSIFFVYVGDHILMFALPLMVFNATNSISAAGFAYFIEWLPRVIFYPFGGYLTDKFGSKRSLIVIDIFKIIACFFVFSLFFTNLDLNIPITIGILAAISSLGTSQTSIAADVLLIKNTNINRYTKVVTYLNISDQASMLIGPALAIFLLSYLEIKYFLLVVPLFYVYNLTNTLTQKWNDGFNYNPNAEKKHFIKDLKSAIMVLRQYPQIFMFSIQAFFVNFIISIIEAAGAPLVKMFFQKSDADFGLLNIIAGLFGAISMIFASYFINEKRAYYFSLIGAIGFLVSSYICINTNGFYLFIVFYGMIIGFTLVNGIFPRVLRKTLVDQALLGKVLGLTLVINQLSVPLSGLMISFIHDINGIKNLMFYATNILFAVFAICFYISFRYRRLDLITPENKELSSKSIENSDNNAAKKAVSVS